MENQGKKLAVLVGCLYKKFTRLYGCINDVKAMEKVLVDRFGFDPTHIEVLTDEPHESKLQATAANIKEALNQMAAKAEKGDILFFHFSGHGTLVRDGQGEAIIAGDLNILTDLDFRDLVNRLPKGATFTMLSDSCHSGGLIGQEKEQIGPSTDKKNNTNNTLSQKPKFVPIETLLQLLSAQTGLNSPDIGTHMLALFGSEASLMFRQNQVADVDKKYRPDDGILLSGCEKNELSGDLSPGQGVAIEKPCGAFSNAVQIVLGNHEGPITNKELVKLSRKVLHKQKIDFYQHPCLYCSDANAGATFLMEKSKI